MNDFLKNNAMSLVIAGLTLASTYAVYGYRLTALEDRQNRQGVVIQQMQTSQTDQNVATQIALAKIQTQLEYMTIQINKILK